VDTAANPRVPILMQMVTDLSRAHDPKEVLGIFAKGMVRLSGPRAYISLSTRGLAPGEYKITRMITDGDPTQMADADPWRDWNSMPVHRGGFLGELLRTPFPELIHNLHVADDPIIGNAIADYRSLMAIPLFENGEALNWSITLRKEPDGFTMADLEESILRTNLGGAAVRNVMITNQLREANHRIQHEINQIAAIQRALLPDQMPEIDGLKIAASYETFDRAGGDYYDFICMSESGQPEADAPWAIVVADASGHGPAAAVVMAMLHSILHAVPCRCMTAAEILSYANEHLCQKRIESSFVTAFIAIYDPKTRQVSYARAGHNPPMLKNPGPGGAVARLDAVGGIPLGVLDDVEYELATFTLQRQQTIVFYTDGITEGANPQGEMFGVQGIEAALTACTGEPECVVNSIGTVLREHESGSRPADDQTIVAIKLSDEPRAAM
jgi:sigma-B regulation protein RsbU (phosphoserine phosphatase)